MKKCILFVLLFTLAHDDIRAQCYLGGKTEGAQVFKDSSEDHKKYKSIKLIFLGSFEDTVVVYSQGKELSRLEVFEKNYPSTSSDYTGYSFDLDMTSKRKCLTIELVNQRICTKFLVDNSFPIVSIQRYNGKFYINKRYAFTLK